MLKDCIARAGKLIPPAYADRMLAQSRALVAEGVDPGQAEIQAVSNMLAEVQRERDRIDSGRASLGEAEDQTYLKALQEGDLVEAGALLHARAKRLGWSGPFYHGTTHAFTEFGNRGNIENDFGLGFYFTSTDSDAIINYAGEGPDLKNRIERRAEQLSGGQVPTAAQTAQARRELHGGGRFLLPVYIRLKNPAVSGGGAAADETFFTYNLNEDGEESGTFLEFIRALKQAAQQYDDTDPDQVVMDLSERALDGDGILLGDAEEILRQSVGLQYAQDDQGNLVAGEIIRDALERMGFDGIVDYGVVKKFGPSRKFGKAMLGVDYGTFHVIAFRPEQVKSAAPLTFDDNGDIVPLGERFNPDSPDIRWNLGDLEGGETVEEARKRQEVLMRSVLASPERTAEERRKLALGRTPFLRSVARFGAMLQDRIGGLGFSYRGWERAMTRELGKSVSDFLPQAWSLIEHGRWSLGERAPSLSEMARYLTPEEYAEVERVGIREFRKVFRMLPSKEEMGSVALAGQVKRGWYRRSAKAIRDVFGHDGPRFAALLAALSPRISVEINLENALRVWAAWNEAGRPTDAGQIRAVLGGAVQMDRPLGSWVNNVVTALTQDPMDLRLSGPKVDSFMRNLRESVNDVTLDAWMASYALVDQKLFSGRKKTVRGVSSGIKDHRYAAMAAAVRQTAEYLTGLTGETWTPEEVQETVWSWAKALYELAEASQVTPSQAVPNLTEEIIYGTPDFATLFTHPRYSSILARSGYGPVGPIDPAGHRVAKGKVSEVRPGVEHLAQAAARLSKVQAVRAELTRLGKKMDLEPDPDQKARIQERMERLSDRTFRGVRSRASLGGAAAPADVDAVINEIRREYPSAPDIVLATPSEPIVGDAPANYQNGRIVVDPSRLNSREEARDSVLASLVDAGASLYSADFWERTWRLAQVAERRALDRILRRYDIDTSTPEGRRSALVMLAREVEHDLRLTALHRRLLRAVRGQSRRLARDLIHALAVSRETFRIRTSLPRTEQRWMGRRRVSTGSGYEHEFFPSEEEARTYAGASGEVIDVTQEQAFADLHGSWWRTLSRRLADFRRVASEIPLERAEEHLWEQLERHITRLQEDAEAASIGAGARERIHPEDAEFEDNYLRLVGRPLSASDLDALGRYRSELEARRIAGAMTRLRSLRETDANLSRMDPRWSDPAHPDYAALEDDRKRLRTTITRLERRIARAAPDVEARAREIVNRRDLLLDARIAQNVLAHPFWVEVAEIIDRIDSSGVVPRELGDLTPEARAAARGVAGTLNARYRRFQQETLDQIARRQPRLEAALRRLRTRLGEVKTESANAEIAIAEVRDALLGAHETSGSLASRDVVTALRDLDVAILFFARALASARPGTRVWEVREMVQAMDPTVPLDMRDEYRREVADAMGISVDALSRILYLIRRSDEFRNGIIAMHDAADRAATSATITAIEQIEDLLAAGDPASMVAARELAGETIARLRRVWRNRERRVEDLTSEITDALVELGTLESLADSSAEAVEDPGWIREMIYITHDGEYLAPFRRADGTEQPEIWIRPGEAFSEAVLASIAAWREAAAGAVAAGDASGNDPETLRGLAVAITDPRSGLGKYMDSALTPSRWRNSLTPGQVFSPLATNSKFGLKSLLPMLLPGPQSARLRAAGTNYIRTAEEVDRVMDANIRQERRMVEEAARALGLDLNAAGGAGAFARAYNEVAHNLRQFGSGVAAGDPLWSPALRGRTVPLELLNLIRFHRSVFQEMQDYLGREPYGGVRLNSPGRRTVRPPAPTGDVGLGRFVSPWRQQELAAAARRGEADLLAFWNQDPEALLFHVLDSLRNDLGTERNPDLLAAEQEAARAIRRAGASAALPTTVEGWADYLATFMRRPDARTFARTTLIEELAQYANLARARWPDDTRTPSTGAGTYFGEQDISEFNTPASKLLYPSSWYTYGASDSLRAAIERMADRRQVEYFAALLAARDDLTRRIAGLQQVLRQQEVTAADLEPFAADIRWHTSWIGASGELNRRLAGDAIRAMQSRRDMLAGHFTEMSAQHSRAVDPLSKVMGVVVPATLSNWTSLVTNVLGGPVRQVSMLRPLIGWPASLMAAIAGPPLAGLSAVYEAALSLLPEQVRSRFRTRNDMVAYILSRGLGSSYSREELIELASWAQGLPGRVGPARILDTWLGAVRAVSEKIGVHAGDKLLNRYAARFVVPLTVWRLQTIARAWRERVGTEYQPGNPDHALQPVDAAMFGEASLADTDRIREILRSLALGSPEDVLAQLLDPAVNARTFWRSVVGRAVGDWVLNEFNVANRLNRPPANFLGFLLGWALSTSASLVEDARSAEAEGPARRLGRKSMWLTGMFVAGLVAGLYQSQGIYFGRMGIAWLASSLAGVLAGDGDDDEQGFVDLVLGLLSRFAAAFATYPTPKTNVMDRSYWMNAGPDAEPGTEDDRLRDPTELAKRLAFDSAKGFGWDLESARVPRLSFFNQLARGAAQAGRGYGLFIEGETKNDAGKTAGGKADMREGVRQITSMLGLFGQVAFNAAFPEDQAGRESRQRILEEAQEIGIIPTAPPPVSAFLTPTPVRRGLQEAGRKIVAGDVEGGTAQARAFAGFIWQRSFDRAIRDGATEADAEKTAEAAVKRNLSGLNPFEAALGRTLTPEQYERLRARLGDYPSIRRDEAAAEAAIRAVSEAPPGKMKRFTPTRAMLSPVKVSGGGRRGGKRRARLGTRGRSRLARRGRLPSLRRVRWA